MNYIYQDELISIKVEPSEIPWLILYVNSKVKELSQATHQEKEHLFRLLDIIEKEMIAYYNPTKINIASFGNHYPHLHFHIMARFKEDSHFPEPMWGNKQRESKLILPPIENFLSSLKVKFNSI